MFMEPAGSLNLPADELGFYRHARRINARQMIIVSTASVPKKMGKHHLTARAGVCKSTPAKLRQSLLRVLTHTVKVPISAVMRPELTRVCTPRSSAS